jgi:hypothetical protein
MKVVVQRDELAQKLGVVARAVSPRSSSVTASQNGMPNSRKVEAAAAKPASESCRNAELSHLAEVRHAPSQLMVLRQLLR